MVPFIGAPFTPDVDPGADLRFARRTEPVQNAAPGIGTVLSKEHSPATGELEHEMTTTIIPAPAWFDPELQGPVGGIDVVRAQIKNLVIGRKVSGCPVHPRLERHAGSLRRRF